MKKLILKIFTVAVLTTLCTVSAAAEDLETGNVESFYELEEKSGFSDLLENSPAEIQNGLETLGVDFENPSGFLNLKPQAIFQLILNAFQSGLAEPLKVTAVAVAFLLLSAMASGLVASNGERPAFIVLLAVTVTALKPLFSLVQMCADAIQSVAGLSNLAVPVLCVVLTAMGRTATAQASSGLVVAACQAVTAFSGYAFVPLTGSLLALSVCSTFSPQAGLHQLVAAVKNISIKAMALAVAVFEFVLSVQTVLTAKGESIGLKAVQSLAGGSLPVVGGAVSGALGSAVSALSAVGSSVGIYVLLGVFLLLLPTLAQLLCWRLGMWLCHLTAQTFGQEGAALLFTALDYVLAVLMGALLLVLLLMFLSVYIILKAGGGL